jgi:hypothetical protein
MKVTIDSSDSSIREYYSTHNCSSRFDYVADNDNKAYLDYDMVALQLSMLSWVDFAVDNIRSNE